MVAEHFLVKIQQSWSFAYVSRYLTKNVVASGLTDKYLINYLVIGVSKPLSIYVKLAEKDHDKITEVEKLLKIFLIYP